MPPFGRTWYDIVTLDLQIQTATQPPQPTHRRTYAPRLATDTERAGRNQERGSYNR